MTSLSCLLYLYEDRIHLFTILSCLDPWISKRFDEYMREMDQDELCDYLITPESFFCIDKVSLGNTIVDWFPTPSLKYKRMVEKYETEIYDYPSVYDSWLDFIREVEDKLNIYYEKYRITHFLPSTKDLLRELEKVLPSDEIPSMKESFMKKDYFDEEDIDNFLISLMITPLFQPGVPVIHIQEYLL